MAPDQAVQVSVVIPAWNRSGLILVALESVARQSLRPLEVIVVDDGSSDDTAKVVDAWKSGHVDGSLHVRCVSQENQGANVARNRGIQESSGNYVAFLDSDDRWLPTKLQKQLALLEKDKSLGGVYCGLCTMDLDSGDKMPQGARAYPEGNLLSKMLIHDISNPTSCWMVRKECFEEVGDFDTSLPARQDWDMWIRLSAEYAIGVVPDVLVEMGEHPGERVRSDPEREIRAHKTIFKKYTHLRKRSPIWVSLAARSAMYRRRGRVYLHRKGSRLKAASYQALAILVWPVEFDSYAALLGTVLPSGFRRRVNVLWNGVFGKTRFGIRSH